VGGEASFGARPLTLRSKGSIVPSGLWISSCSGACPARQDGCQARAPWEGLGRSWFVTTCLLGPWDVCLAWVHVAGVLRLNQLLSYILPIDIGCREVRNLSPTGALFLFHNGRLFDPERRLVCGSPRKSLGTCWRVTNKGESWFGKANNNRVAVSAEQYYGEPLNTAKGPLHGSVSSPCEDCVLRGCPVGSLVSFPSALIKCGGSCPPLPLVELIQKVSTLLLGFGGRCCSYKIQACHKTPSAS